MRTPLIASSLVLLMAGCTTPFQYEPFQGLPASYKEVASRGASLSAPELAVWWEQFQDPVLNELITETLARNNDLKIALARVDQARAAERGARAQLLPNVGLGLQTKRYHGGETESILLNQIGIDEFTATHWQAGLQVGWEVDLFGAGRARLAATREQGAAAAADVQAIRLSLMGSVAGLYASYRGLQQQQLVLLDSLKEAREFLDIAQRSFAAGVVLSTDVNLAQAGVSQVEARLQNIDASLARVRLNLENIAMLPPGSLDEKLATPAPVPQLPAAVAPGQPGELLMRRPDLIAAEARFRASLKQGEAARLDYLPKLSLAGLIGRSGLDVGSVATSGGLWLATAALAMPLIDFGARQSQVELTDARSREALLAYEKTALGALFDVERALAQLKRDAGQQQATRAEIEQRNLVLQKTTRQYELGDAGRLEMAQARVALLDSRASLISQQISQLQSQIALFLAMGGGWEVSTGDTLPPEPSGVP